MASFFSMFTRALMGRPLENAEPAEPDDSVQPAVRPAPQTPTIRKGDAGTFPVVSVKRTSVRLSGRTMEVRCQVQNDSPFRITLDRFRLGGAERRIDADLRPHEGRECLAYQGSLMAHPQPSQATLDYRTETGDYFEAIHEVRFDYHADTKLYSIDELRWHPPIRDIYG